MTVALTDLTLEELHAKLIAKEIVPSDIVEALFEKIEATDDIINAYISTYKEEALSQAEIAEKEIAEGRVKGPLHGIPLAVKDNIFYKNHVTTMASKIHEFFIPDHNATVMTKLKDAGAIIIGKLNMHEYALSITNDNPHFGPVRNPWNKEKISGGSSGGSAASVAVGSTPVSIGTDTAGSIRIPAAACGVVGLKPTRGVVSAHGVYPLSWTQDHVGPMAKTVKDTAILLESIADFDENDPVSVESNLSGLSKNLTGNISGLTIGIDEAYFFNNIDAPIEKAVRVAVDELKSKGAIIKKVTIPALKDMDWAGFTLTVSEGSAIHKRSILERPEDFGEDIRPFLQMGAFPSSKDYANAQKAREQIIHDFEEVFQQVDVLISPTIPVFPNNIGESEALLNGEKVELLPHFIRLTGPANIAGLPALSVPCGVHEGLPIGLQIIGKAFADETVLQTGLAVEKLKRMEGYHVKES